MSHERHVVIDNVCLNTGGTGIGINTNWGDTATLTNIKLGGKKPTAENVCCTYKGVPKGSEPPKIGWYVEFVLVGSVRLTRLYSGEAYAGCGYSEAAVGTCS